MTRGEFFDQPAFHAEMRCPGRFGGIEVEAGALPHVIRRIVGDAVTARACVGRDQHQAEFGGEPLGAGLDGKGFLGAGQAGEAPEHGEGAHYPAE